MTIKGLQRRGHASTDAQELASDFETRFRIEERPINSLVANPRNARTHSPKQIARLAESVAQFGFITPIVVDQDGKILSGHGRVEAARLLDYETVPTIRIDHLSEAQKRAYVIADNKIAQLAGWDDEMLALELGELAVLDLDFSLEVTGFEGAEIDGLIVSHKDDQDSERDNAVPSVDNTSPAVSLIGDIWACGEHLLLCGDSRYAPSYERLLGNERAQMVWSDPPWNVPIDGHVGGLGRTRHREFVMASGEMSDAEFETFLQSSLLQTKANSIDGAIHYYAIDWRHVEVMAQVGRESGFALKNIAVWVKDNGGMGSFLRSQHELVFVFKTGTQPHINNVLLGKNGRNRTNVWFHKGANSFGTSRMDTLRIHPTSKPVSLVADCIFDCSHRGGIVLDPFVGSGTTMIAAAKTGRRARCIELDPKYVDAAIIRWQEWSGERARHAVTGEAFDDTARIRTNTRDRQRTWR